MTVNEKIVMALSQFKIPIETDFSGGSEEEYFTFNYASDRAENFGDDKPLNAVASMQIHYFLPVKKDYLSVKKQIRNALFAAGFTYPVVTHLTEDKKIRHLIFECEIENDDELM